MSFGPNELALVAGTILSLAISYIPGVNTAYEGLSPTSRRLVMALLLVVAAVGSAFWACSAPENQSLRACFGGVEWRTYVTTLISALVANQATHRITPQPEGKV